MFIMFKIAKLVRNTFRAVGALCARSPWLAPTPIVTLFALL